MLLLYFRTRTSPGHVNSTKIIKRNIFWCMINLASCQLEIASFIIYQDYISLIWLLSGTIDSGNCLNSNFDIVKNVSFKNGHFLALLTEIVTAHTESYASFRKVSGKTVQPVTKSLLPLVSYLKVLHIKFCQSTFNLSIFIKFCYRLSQKITPV